MPVGVYERKARGAYVTRYKGSCYSCGDTNSGKYSWYRNHDADDNALCGLCYRRLILNPKWGPITRKKWNPVVNKRRIHTRGRAYFLAVNPRVGVCNLCRSTAGVDCKFTHLHHERYDDIGLDVLKNTLEVCPSCHGKLRPKTSPSCYACGTTQRTKAGWYHNDPSTVLCSNCYLRYVYRPALVLRR